MSLYDFLELMQNEMQSANEQVTKFLNGNKSAGTRARKSMQTIKTAAQNVRLEIQSMKNNS
jgi:hypothetical protein|tara:strand:+ start:399 stop:581 length:183 start_codon:yes stop_codon:yes gene_type:complete